MSYYENVRAAGLALKRGEEANWELARLTFENTIDATGPRGAGRVAMAVWCRDVQEVSGRRFGERSGEAYKAIWARYGVTAHHGPRLPSWSDAYESVRPGREQRFSDWSATNVVEKAPPATKVETFRRLSEDPEVRADKTAQTAALDFGVQVYRQREQDVRDHWRQDEHAERQEVRLEAVETVLSVEKACDDLAAAIRVFEQRVALLTTKDRPEGSGFSHLGAAVTRAREGLERVEHWITHGRSDIDTFVASVLRREE